MFLLYTACTPCTPQIVLVQHEAVIHRSGARWYRVDPAKPQGGSVTQNLGQIIQASGGIFSRSQALECGETDRTLAAALRDGALVRLRRGLYVPADIYAAADPSAKHVLNARAALASQRGRVGLTGVSARSEQDTA